MSAGPFSRVKYKDKVYNVGDFLLMREKNGGLLVCKLLEVIPYGGMPEYEEWPSIRVQWFYHNSELDLTKLGIPAEDRVFIGDNEIFESDYEEIVYIGFIAGKCDVLTIEQYDQCQATTETTYYSRAKFITKEDRLEPPYDKWETLCSCKKPMNPNMLTVG